VKFLVTGGCGFIGTHLTRKLVELGHKVSVIDNLSTKKFTITDVEFVVGVDYHITDIRYYDKILPLFKGIDGVFHLAAEARIQASIDNPKHAVDANILGTTHVLEACRIQKVKRIINSSTSAIYGLTDQFPTHESTEPGCLNPYASTKLAAEIMTQCYFKTYNLESYNLRYFNVFGEGSPVTGPYSLVIGIFLDQLARGESLTVVDKGESLRDFVYVGDVVDANIKAMTQTGTAQSEILNIGSGTNVSILEIAKAMSDNIVFVSSRPGECKQTLADISKAKEFLDWGPTTKLLDWLQKSNH
jgi:UDP-glucose 4-epimerase